MRCFPNLWLDTPRQSVNPGQSGPIRPIAPQHRVVILIVDDENGIREFLVTFIEASGFTVVSASSAEEALDLWEDHATEIKAVITDIVMPGMNGKVLGEKLRALRPELPIIFISGYLPEEIAEGTLDGFFFKKPFSPMELLEALQRAIA